MAIMTMMMVKKIVKVQIECEVSFFLMIIVLLMVLVVLSYCEVVILDCDDE